MWTLQELCCFLRTTLILSIYRFQNNINGHWKDIIWMMWPASKLCLRFIFKCPCWNQIWPNFVFTAGFCMGRWPQNTARLSLKEYSRLPLTPFELQDIFRTISPFPFVNDGVQKAKSEISDSWKFTIFFWKALSAWPRNFTKCQRRCTSVQFNQLCSYKIFSK